MLLTHAQRRGRCLYLRCEKKKFGLVFAEARALAATPCIAPDVGGISSVSEHDLTGNCALPESDIGLCEACKTLFTDRKAAREMGKQGHHRVLQNFTIFSKC